MGEDEFTSLLKKFTDDELENELKRRRQAPDPLESEDVNISNIRKHAKEYIESVHKTGRPPKDAEHFIFESVMATFYGNDIWSWLNENKEEIV